ncbi:hypothetical protein BX659_1025 [Orenia metallireducens]|uniref:Uncharacterized protein n=1 Tax=Orenia metallireducens TaxID=1413210 RepID=A0A285F1L3_9FIRM|nr:hypothetical protein BX659_1025 [Orenia metallireducens]SNY05185.1 hypothetical protein SAMN06265827_1015 [Orenia metallireducens]
MDEIDRLFENEFEGNISLFTKEIGVNRRIIQKDRNRKKM